MGTDRLEGTVLGGRYQVEQLLGQGGMSAVYKASDPNLQRIVAIKLIHTHLSNNPEFVRRFESEATSIAKLRHPNIVQVFDLNHDGDLYFMVLEYVAGETLQSRMKRLSQAGRQIPIPEALRIMIQICNAADYAHQRGMIHRDIKPANIMLDVNGNAILMDFGIAHLMEGQQHTATGALLGTALYMSPEQIRGLHPDGRADIYSIGVTLFEMLSGRPPFEADSAMTLMMMHMNDPVPDLNELRPGIPPQVRAIVNRALEKDRANRFQSCTEMAAALQQALDTLNGVVTTPPPAVSREQRPAGSLPETVIEVAPRADMLGTIVEPTAPVPAKEKYQQTFIESQPGQAAIPTGLGEAALPAPPIARRNPLVWIIPIILVLALAGGGFLFKDTLLGLVAQATPTVLATLPPTAVAAVQATATATTAPTGTPPPPTATLSPSDTPMPLPTATLTPAPTDTVIVPTGTLAPTPLPALGGADKIAYLYGNDIWVANIDGSAMQQITTDGIAKKYLRWLPDGQRIAYIMGTCIQTVTLTDQVTTITCFNGAEYLDTFEISPDGKRVALSVDHELFLLPFNLDQLSKADTMADLTAMADCKELAPFKRNAATTARWSRDSTLLAAVTLGVLSDGRRGDIVQMFAVDQCIADPAIKLQFPPPHFNFGEYNRNPTLAGFTWDGENVFVMNGITRNDGFGEMHIFKRKTYEAITHANPVDGSCCYRDPLFSPDGTYLIFAFQDIRQGADSKTMLYYIQYGTIGLAAKYTPLPLQIYTNPREAPQPALRPAKSP